MNTIVERIPARAEVNASSRVSAKSAVAWSATLAGAAGSVAPSLIRAVLATGLGLSP